VPIDRIRRSGLRLGTRGATVGRDIKITRSAVGEEVGELR